MSKNITEIFFSESTDSTTYIRAHCTCDTAADLPGPTDFTGYTLIIGSTADDISTGDKYKMQSSGTWVKQPVSQSDTYTTSQIDTLIDGRIPYEMTDTIPASDDLDNYTLPGTFDMAAGVTHAPSGGAGRLDVIQIPGSGMVQQRYLGTGSTTRMYVRNMQSISPLSWHPWAPVDTLAIGIGSALSNNDDLNTMTTYGVYVAASTAIASSIQHRPNYSSSGNKMFTVRVEAHRFRRLQSMIVVDISGGGYGNLEFFYRIGESDGSRWGSWHQMTTTIVGDYP